LVNGDDHYFILLPQSPAMIEHIVEEGSESKALPNMKIDAVVSSSLLVTISKHTTQTTLFFCILRKQHNTNYPMIYLII